MKGIRSLPGVVLFMSRAEAACFLSILRRARAWSVQNSPYDDTTLPHPDDGLEGLWYRTVEALTEGR